MMAALSSLPLPAGIRSRSIDNGNGLLTHFLEAGFDEKPRPVLLLLHGFPELAYSWRKVMLPLAQAGYHVVAPDQRGYGRTEIIGANRPVLYDDDLRPYNLLNLVRDALGLIWALGKQQVHAVIGHDFGSPVAAWCALTRPDVFRKLVLMSAPFGGPPAHDINAAPIQTVIDALGQLQRPRQHYQWYYAERGANDDMLHAPQGLHAFLRGYYHVKSADWQPNQPTPLGAFSAANLAKLPTYYVMEAADNMAQTVAPHQPNAAQIAACHWLPDDELAVYASKYARTGFQGGLQWYRCGTTGAFTRELQLFAGRTIDVPTLFISGKSDWGTYQKPGEFERMQTHACTQFRGVALVEGAGHWVQQEQAARVVKLLRTFLQNDVSQ